MALPSSNTGSGTASRKASHRFRRSPATGALQEWRREWGKAWGAVNRELAKGLRAEGG